MRNSSDPSTHRQREQRLIEHVERLLNDDRLRIDTINGRRAVATLRGGVRKEDRGADRRLILVERNDAGGWTVSGPAQIKALSDLFDPEVDTEKRKRIHEAIDQSRAELLGGGLSAGMLAASTRLPLQLVEEELKS